MARPAGKRVFKSNELIIPPPARAENLKDGEEISLMVCRGCGNRAGNGWSEDLTLRFCPDCGTQTMAQWRRRRVGGKLEALFIKNIRTGKLLGKARGMKRLVILEKQADEILEKKPDPERVDRLPAKQLARRQGLNLNFYFEQLKKQFTACDSLIKTYSAIDEETGLLSAPGKLDRVLMVKQKILDSLSQSLQDFKSDAGAEGKQNLPPNMTLIFERIKEKFPDLAKDIKKVILDVMYEEVSAPESPEEC